MSKPDTCQARMEGDEADRFMRVPKLARFRLHESREPEETFTQESYERTFHEAGSFPCRCKPHPKMTGEIHVTE